MNVYLLLIYSANILIVLSIAVSSAAMFLFGRGTIGLEQYGKAVMASLIVILISLFTLVYVPSVLAKQKQPPAKPMQAIRTLPAAPQFIARI